MERFVLNNPVTVTSYVTKLFAEKKIREHQREYSSGDPQPVCRGEYLLETVSKY
jgi:hypothetical protein